jgi:hypothetical protein
MRFYVIQYPEQTNLTYNPLKLPAHEYASTQDHEEYNES